MDQTITLYGSEQETICKTIYKRLIELTSDRKRAIEVDDGAGHDALVDEYNDLFAVYRRIMVLSEEDERRIERQIKKDAGLIARD